MWSPLPPAPHTSLVGTRHQAKKGSQVSVTLERRLHLASLPLLQELKLTSGIHLRPGWKQGARERRMDSCWNTALSQAAAVRKTGQAASTHATSLATSTPRSRVYSNMRFLAAPTH